MLFFYDFYVKIDFMCFNLTFIGGICKGVDECIF